MMQTLGVSSLAQGIMGDMRRSANDAQRPCSRAGSLRERTIYGNSIVCVPPAREQFVVHGSEARRVKASAELLSLHTQLRLVIQAAIWLRFDKLSLVRMC